MKEEILRLDKVTYLDQGVTELKHFTLNAFVGEILGLIPVNGTGMQSLMRLLRQNIPIHYGYIYYREKLVNHWLNSNSSYNRIGIIEHRSGLADDLTVSDNVFVLRTGFGKRIIQRSVLRRQLEPFLEDIGVTISADAYVRDLTVFHRFVVELVKAIVAGNRLIILVDAGTIVSDAELQKLHDILHHYAAQGFSFLYVSQHYEEISRVCDRVALMMNGQIAKVLSTKDTESEIINWFEHFDRLAHSQRKLRSTASASEPALEVRDLWHGGIQGLHLSIAPGECVVVQDLDNHMLDDLVDVVTGAKQRSGTIHVCGKKLPSSGSRDVAVIQKLATKTMLFPELSYLDNLCFTLDHRLSRIWLHSKHKESIQREYGTWLGQDVFDKSIDELTQTQKCDLIYTRILLQRPKVIFCVQPFMQADVEQRMHIWQLIERFLEKQIAVVILAINLADTLSLADRLILIQNGRVLSIYDRSEFGGLPNNALWRYLWNEPGILDSVREQTSPDTFPTHP